MSLQSSIIGRTFPTGLPCGGTLTIVSVSIVKGFADGLPVIECELKWKTGNSLLDGANTVGSLAPGTALWHALNTSGPIDR